MSDLPQHPGERIQAELNRRGWTAEHLAARTGMHVAWIEDLLVARRWSVTPMIAARLADVLGQTPEHWLELQRAYDRADAVRA